ncbi:MAG: hypothetical protein A4E37_00871 [Methanoregulaceae archaeon PtaB.Bin056]|nr:MAG: hypothetical protein A4E37_00871 [Methanoregulaceae archaeon PtaB.Bin056]
MRMPPALYTNGEIPCAPAIFQRGSDQRTLMLTVLWDGNTFCPIAKNADNSKGNRRFFLKKREDQLV